MPLWLLDLVEALFLALVAVGVGLIFLPAGLIVAGLLGILACEWIDIQRKLRAVKARR